MPANPTPEALARARMIDIGDACRCVFVVATSSIRACPIHLSVALARDAHAAEQSTLVEAMEAQRLSLAAANESCRRAMDTIVDRLRGALEPIKATFHPKGPGDGACFFCAKPGGEHLEDCKIKSVVDALALVPAAFVERAARERAVVEAVMADERCCWPYDPAPDGSPRWRRAGLVNAAPCRTCIAARALDGARP